MKNHILSYLMLFILAALAMASCKKGVEEMPEPLKSGQVRFTVSNETFEYDSLLNTSVSSFTADTLTYSTAWFTPNDPNNFQIIIGISHLPTNGAPPTPQDIWALFEPGSKSYARAGQQPNGAVVEWRGREGVSEYYYANTRLGVQSDASFIITERAPFPDFLPVFEVAGTFRCTVYDGGQHMHRVIHGAFRGMVPLY